MENKDRKNYVLKGNVCYTPTRDKFCIVENGYVVCKEGRCAGVYETLPQEYESLPCMDYGDRLIFPGLVDLHVHAPQYAFRGIGMDLELIDWLNTHTFAEEQKYQSLDYAKNAYEIFCEDLVQSATTRACIFGTIHTEATLCLMELLEQSGMSAYVGKVNMDRNSPEDLCEADWKQAAEDTEKWILQCETLEHVKPILTPRFIPSCSDALMEALSKLQKQYHLPIQSHLSENLGEIQWVKELCPDTSCYGDAYQKYEMFGGECPTIMAHCVHSTEEVQRMMKEQGVFIAHCPESNTNLSSGIAPVRRYLEQGISVGLGSDVAAGTSLSMFRAMAMASQCSKLRWRLTDQSLAPLTVSEAFYLATKGGGAFFGKAGSFEKGYEFDAVVLDDAEIRSPRRLTVKERIERLLYLAEDRHITAKYICGREIFSKVF